MPTNEEVKEIFDKVQKVIETIFMERVKEQDGTTRYVDDYWYWTEKDTVHVHYTESWNYGGHDVGGFEIPWKEIIERLEKEE